PRQETDHRIPVNHEANPEVAEMLSRAPCAIPLPGSILRDEGLAVADVTPGLLLNRYAGDLEVRVDDSEPVISARRPSGNLETIEMNAGRRESTAPSAKLTVSPAGNGKRIPKSRTDENGDR